MSKDVNNLFNIPYWLLKINLHEYETAVDAVTSGKKKAVWNADINLIFWFNKFAIIVDNIKTIGTTIIV